MYCPRPDHFVRFHPEGTVSCCGHMIGQPTFNSYEEMQASDWMTKIKQAFEKDHWPKECIRCKQTEEISNSSIRLNAIKFNKLQKKKDYLTVGGILDNVCNSACQFCSEELSTKIGGLTSKQYPIYDNSKGFWALPLDRVVHLDINGGEPSASKNYKEILRNPPKNVKSIRINTNCALVINELESLLEKGIHITVTVSFDGIGKVHDYVRWPIKWDKFYSNLMKYKAMGINNLNLWTTVNSLNVGDFANIIDFKNEHELDHSWALLNQPEMLDIRYENWLTLGAREKLLQSKNLEVLSLLDQLAILENNNKHLVEFIKQQDAIRKINYKDYYQ